MKRFASIVCAGLVLSYSTLTFGQPTGGPPFELERLTENVYRYGPTSNTLLVTDEGIVMIDGTCAGGGQERLKEEIERRFDVPVRYIFLSHDHGMHICGLEIYADTAVAIAHRKALPHIVREQRETLVPQILFDDQMEIVLGGQRVVGYYFGPTHSNNLIQVHIPDEGVLVATDIVRQGKSIGLPDYRDSNVDIMIDVLAQLAMLPDVDIVVPGHAGLADQQSFLYFRDFLIALRDEVLEEMQAGSSIEEIVENVNMESFSDYGNYDNWLRANIITMWDYLYHYREPEEGLGEYQNAFPTGFPIGETNMFGP